MNFHSAVIPLLSTVIALALVLPSLLAALYYAPWKALLAKQQRQHLWLASVVLLPFFWLLNIEIDSNIEIHLLAVTSLTLIFGWSLALLASVVALVLYTLLFTQQWLALPFNALLTCWIPCAVSYLTLQLISRWRFTNLFVYMLGAGFFGAVFSILALSAALQLFARLEALSVLALLVEQYSPYILLLAFPEGFINGTIVSALTVFYPQLLKTFDEKRYLDSDR